MSSESGVSLSESDDYLPHVRIIGLGGTIAGAAADASKTTVYKPGEFDIESLLTAIPQLSNIANLSGEDFLRIGSPDITSENVIALALHINIGLAKKEVDAVVVSTGTDSLEELAYYLWHLVKSNKPVIVTGAMLPKTAMSADGDRNLYTSVLTAVSQKSKGRGVLGVMNNRIFSGCYIVKGDANQVEAFTGGVAGCLGRLHGDEVIYFYEPSRPTRPRVDVVIKKGDKLPLVQVLYGHPEVLIDLDWHKKKGIKGFILAGMGAGCWTTDGGKHIREFIEDNEDIPVVVSRRTAEGYVGHGSIYGLGDKCIGAGDLNPAKARVNLQLLLHKGASREEIKQSFVPGYDEE